MYTLDTINYKKNYVKNKVFNRSYCYHKFIKFSYFYLLNITGISITISVKYVLLLLFVYSWEPGTVSSTRVEGGGGGPGVGGGGSGGGRSSGGRLKYGSLAKNSAISMKRL